MKLKKWAWTLFPCCGFLGGLLVIHSTSGKFEQRRAKLSKAEPTWNELVDKSLAATEDKSRVLTPESAEVDATLSENTESTPSDETVSADRKPSRGIASQPPPQTITNGKAKFTLQGNEIINIEKNNKLPERQRLLVTNVSTGKKAYLSGEIVIATKEISKLPVDFDGISLQVTRELGNNKYIISVTPPTEVPKALDRMKTAMRLESLKVDVVDREIKPR